MRAGQQASDDDRSTRLFRLLIGVYLGGGLLNSIVSLLVPRLKITLGLDYHQALAVQLAYYASYLLFALPITFATARLGYMRAIAAGLALIAIACPTLAAAHAARHYPSVLMALLLLSAGVTVLQIAGNAVITAAPSLTMTSRFTLLQAFNSLGTVLGPLVGSWFLLGDWRGPLVPAAPFLAIALGLLVLSIAFLHQRALLADTPVPAPPSLEGVGRLLRRRRTLAGIATIFAYVGAEVTVGTLAVNYLMLPGTVGASPLVAGRLVSLYWACAMLGRFGGAYLVRRISGQAMLALAGCGALLMLAIVIGVGGPAGAVAILLIGLFNSVIFPIGYALALPEGGKDGALAAMLLCMAVVGGAIIPTLTGYAADAFGLRPSFVVPGLCYLVIVVLALRHAPHAPERS
jgi:FHS family L-fucose permease-like MFS transporter